MKTDKNVRKQTHFPGKNVKLYMSCGKNGWFLKKKTLK